MNSKTQNIKFANRCKGSLSVPSSFGKIIIAKLLRRMRRKKLDRRNSFKNKIFGKHPSKRLAIEERDHNIPLVHQLLKQETLNAPVVIFVLKDPHAPIDKAVAAAYLTRIRFISRSTHHCTKSIVPLIIYFLNSTGSYECLFLLYYLLFNIINSQASLQSIDTAIRALGQIFGQLCYFWMWKMIKDCIVLLMVACFCVCQEYDDDDYSEIQNTVESGSREVFNVSCRKRPERVINLLNGNHLKVDGAKRVRTPGSTWRSDLKTREPETTESSWITESETKVPTWMIEATEKPIWRIDSIKPKSAVTNKKIKPTAEHNRRTKSRPREPQWIVEQTKSETTEPTEEITEATEEAVKATKRTIHFRAFNAERFKNADDSNEDDKQTETNNFKEEQKKRDEIEHNQVTNAEEQRKEPLVNYPFAVSIQRMGSHYASGALLDKKWVLSSAGEFYNVRESIKIYRARLGSVDCKRGGTVVPLKSIEIHPSFVPGKPNYDIAMIRLAQLIDYTDNIRPIGLTKIQDKVLSAKFLATYWPRVVIKGTVLPYTAKEREKYNSMRVSTQRLIPWDKCYQRLTQQKESLAESSLCLRPVLAHHTACLPDVGAPVVANDGLWGITSGWTSEDCAKGRHPSPIVVARVSASTVRSWLNSLLLAPEN